MRHVYRLAIVLMCCISCTGVEKKNKNQLLAADSLVYQVLDTTGGISQSELLHYHNACKDFFDSILPIGIFNGSILVARKGNILFEEYSGFTDPKLKQDTLTAKTAFHLASVSKTFTAMAILKLKEQGKLNLDDTLSKYFKDFPYPGITIKMLLSHRSGLPNYLHYFDKYKWDTKKMVTNGDVLRSLYDFHPPLDFASGKHFAYCNTNFVLLALIIETVSGEAYKTYLENTFFRPLQMNDTYVFAPADMSRALPSFEWNNRKFPYEFLDVVYGDKNIYSTVRDMLKWDQALYAGRLFTKETLDSAFAPYSFEHQGKRNYGLGWRMTFLDNGKKLLYHNGWWHGSNTVFIRLIDEDAVIIVLSNKFNRRIYSTKNLCNLFGDYMQNGDFEE
ncbi:MAG: serine hydrolase domain-containing protein [Chitinophagaceae bacterium]